MDRRAFVWTLVGSLLSAPLPVAQAQRTGKPWRIGILGTGTQQASKSILDKFHEGLQEHGYVKGRDIVLDYRYADGKPELLPHLAEELISLKPDVLVTGVNASVIALKNQTSTTPIVMILATDPVATGLIESFARPGGNITGLTYDVTPETAGKLPELFKEALPGLSRVAIVFNPDFRPNAAFLRAIDDATKKLKITTVKFEGKGQQDFEDGFRRISREHVGGIIVLGDGVTYTLRGALSGLAAQYKLPVIFQWREGVLEGGLMSYGVDMPDLARRGAGYVDRILKGSKPADLAVEQPTKFELVINLKTAKALGLTIPPSLLQRADQVIE